MNYSPVGFYSVCETYLPFFLIQAHTINYATNSTDSLAHIKLIAFFYYISILCQFVIKEQTARLWLEMDMAGHLKTYQWYVRHSSWLKSRAGLARQRPVSPKPPHLLSHVFAHLYNLKWIWWIRVRYKKHIPKKWGTAFCSGQTKRYAEWDVNRVYLCLPNLILCSFFITPLF